MKYCHKIGAKQVGKKRKKRKKKNNDIGTCRKKYIAYMMTSAQASIPP